MYRLKILILFFLFIPTISFSQENTLDYKTVDYKTFGYYVNQNWDSLIYMGNNAIENNIDYYYLRVRLGIAYYEKHKYLKATPHFEQALKFNSQEDFVKEYLYYCYLLSGRETEATLLSKSMSDTIKQRNQISSSKLISQVYAEGGYVVSNNESKNQHIDFDGIYNIYGETDLAKEKYFFHFGLQHNMGKKFSIYHAYNYLTIANTKIVKTFNTIRVTDNYTSYQHEYYINASCYMKQGFSLTPAFHYNYLKYKLGYMLKDTVINNYVGSLEMSKYYPNSNISFAASFSNFDTTKQIQAGLYVTLYAFNNLKLYSTTGLISKNVLSPPDSHKGPGNGRNGNGPGNKPLNSSVIFYQLLGFNFYKNNWLELSATFGDLKNYNEKNAMIIYNSPDKINYKLEGKLLFQINKKLRLSLGYQYWDFTGTYLTKPTFLPDDFQEFTTNYQNHLITGGLIWKL